MRLIKPSYEILTPIKRDDIYKAIEVAARTCYKSEDKITEDSAAKMVARLIASGHEAMIEHSGMTVKFVCDRGVSHELVRHRIASFAQESTRYCNYSKDKFGGELIFIEPLWLESSSEESKHNFKTILETCDRSYIHLLQSGWTPQQARSVLPNALKTEIVVTANFREWRQIFKLRAAKAAHPQMRELMIPLLAEMKEKMPEMFNDINIE